MSEEALNRYGFVTAAWKRGLVIGFLTLQTIAIVWLAKTTVPQSQYNDLIKGYKELQKRHDVLQYTLVPQLIKTKMLLEQMQEKVDTIVPVLEETQFNLQTIKTKAHEALKK